MDWNAVFAVKVPVVELVVRASVMYLFLFVLFRFGLRRDIGALGLADVLVLVIIADASQNAMAGPVHDRDRGRHRRLHHRGVEHADRSPGLSLRTGSPGLPVPRC